MPEVLLLILPGPAHPSGGSFCQWLKDPGMMELGVTISYWHFIQLRI